MLSIHQGLAYFGVSVPAVFQSRHAIPLILLFDISIEA
jgi:hypothetical protein